jgi:hypothetical protein
VQNALNDLIDNIRDAIEQRGFYMLLDSRIDLICGEKGSWKKTAGITC